MVWCDWVEISFRKEEKNRREKEEEDNDLIRIFKRGGVWFYDKLLERQRGGKIHRERRKIRERRKGK